MLVHTSIRNFLRHKSSKKLNCKHLNLHIGKRDLQCIKQLTQKESLNETINIHSGWKDCNCKAKQQFVKMRRKRMLEKERVNLQDAPPVNKSISLINDKADFYYYMEAKRKIDEELEAYKSRQLQILGSKVTVDKETQTDASSTWEKGTQCSVEQTSSEEILGFLKSIKEDSTEIKNRLNAQNSVSSMSTDTCSAQNNNNPNLFGVPRGLLKTPPDDCYSKELSQTTGAPLYVTPLHFAPYSTPLAIAERAVLVE